MSLLQKTRKILKPLVGPSTFVGLDIGTRAIKLVVLEECDGAIRVINAHRRRVTESLISDEKSLQECIDIGLRDVELSKLTPCMISLPSTLIDYQSLDWMGDLESSRAGAEQVMRLMHELLGDDLDRATFDYWITDTQASKYDIHLVWTVAELANRVTRAVQGVGLRPYRIDAPAKALGRINWKQGAQDSCLIVDAGGGEANFVWSQSRVAKYVRSQIRFSSHSAPEHLASSIGIDSISAEQILRDYGVACHSASPIASDNLRSLNEWLEQLLFEINRTSQFLLTKYGPKSVGELLICGGVAEISGMDRWIEQQTGIPTQCAQLPDGTSWSSAERFTPTFAQAVALAMQGVQI